MCAARHSPQDNERAENIPMAMYMPRWDSRCCSLTVPGPTSSRVLGNLLTVDVSRGSTTSVTCVTEHRQRREWLNPVSPSLDPNHDRRSVSPHQEGNGGG